MLQIKINFRTQKSGGDGKKIKVSFKANCLNHYDQEDTRGHLLKCHFTRDIFKSSFENHWNARKLQTSKQQVNCP